MGAAVLCTGLLIAGTGSLLEQPNVVQVLQGIGAGLAVMGGILTLFGALNTYMTVFSAFSTFMVTVGVAEVILVLGVMNGFQGDLRSKIIDTYAHVTIEADAPGELLADYASLAKQVRTVEGVVGATPILRTEVMLSAPTNMAAAALVGIDPGSIAETSRLTHQLNRGCIEVLADPRAICAHWALESADRVKGVHPVSVDVVQNEDAPAEKKSPPDDEDELMAFPAPERNSAGPPPRLLVGAELRRNLSVWPDELINVVSPTGDLGPEGPVPRSRPFQLGGWFASGMLEFDTKLAYAGLSAVQQYMGVDDVASAIHIRVADLEGARNVRDRLRAVLPKRLRVTDWQERNRSLFSALKLEKVAMFLILTINILLAAFSITSTLVMTIIERKREIAILMAMGSSTRSVLKIFMSQGAFTGAVGSVLGSTIGLASGLSLAKLGLPLNQDVYYISAVPVDVRTTDVVAIIIVALLVSLASTVYPALYASRLRPVEGLNGE
jgi:lipoprotein-releasing system permease protein